jgi:hypothetical protein
MHDIWNMDRSKQEQRGAQSLERPRRYLFTEATELERYLQPNSKIPLIHVPTAGVGTCDLAEAVGVNNIAARIVLHARNGAARIPKVGRVGGVE